MALAGVEVGRQPGAGQQQPHMSTFDLGICQAGALLTAAWPAGTYSPARAKLLTPAAVSLQRYVRGHLARRRCCPPALPLQHRMLNKVGAGEALQSVGRPGFVCRKQCSRSRR